MSLRNVDIILNTLRIIFNKQNFSLIKNQTTIILLKDPSFLKNIIRTADRLIEIYFYYNSIIKNKAFTDYQFYSLLKILNDFGILLTDLFEKNTFLKPFQFYGQKLSKFLIKFFYLINI